MIAFGTASGSCDRPNEDWVGATARAIVVLDGLSAPEGVGGCHHGTPWYVARLGTRLLTHIVDTTAALQSVLASAIDEVADLHRDTCDLRNSGTPSAAVAMVRSNALSGSLEGLVLADSSVVLETDSGVAVLSDTRVNDVATDEHNAVLASPAGPDRDRRLADLVRVQRELRNVSHGYWVAQADARAAEYAFTREWPLSEVHRIAVMTDGASRLNDVFREMSWPQILDLLEGQGPDELIAATRSFEVHDPDAKTWPRYKQSDDATVAYWNMEPHGR